MRQLRDMSIIEIDITNACIHSCSNCTRFCGHHQKPYYMNFETFRRAVDSLEDFEGLVSIIGGEPTLHPELDRFLEYLENTGRAEALTDGRSKAMVKDYLTYAREQRWFNLSCNKGKGYNLFSSVSQKFYLHYERIQDAVTHMFLNDHSNPSFHQPILVSRKDLGIGDAEFAALRDNCWLQNFWSAGITPKGGFFCEVAGTLDLLLNGPGGVRVEPGWWKQDISAFREQFVYCDYCGMALKTYSRNANQGIDDISETLYQKLKALDSPKLKKGTYQMVYPEKMPGKDGDSIGEDMETVTGNYEPVYEKRMHAAADSLKPSHVYGLIHARGRQAWKTAVDLCRKFSGVLDGFWIAATQENLEMIPETPGILYRMEASDSSPYGEILSRGLWRADARDWLVVIEENTVLPKAFARTMRNRYLNPGYLFLCKFGSQDPEHTVMACKLAGALKKNGLDLLRKCKTEQELSAFWGEKHCVLSVGFEEWPDIDIPYFRERVYESYRCDSEFCLKLKVRLKQQGIMPGEPVLVFHSAFVYHTLSIIRILQDMGYPVYALASEKFREHYQGWLMPEQQIFFKAPSFQLDLLKEDLDRVKKMESWGGILLPCYLGGSSLKPIDDYTGVLECASYTGRILGIINIRRQFITPDYESWEIGGA